MAIPRRALAALLLLAACDHTLASEPRVAVQDSLVEHGPPERLTVSPGKDATPAWSPDGRGIWYAWERLDRRDRDLCLGRLPATGGTRTDEACRLLPPASQDSVNWFLWPAPHPDGRRVLWFRWSQIRTARAGGRGEFVIAPIDRLADPTAERVLRRFPFTPAPPDGPLHTWPESPQWVDETTLVYLATQQTVPGNTATTQDTIYRGIELAKLLLTAADTASVTPIPGTDSASGFTLAPGGVIYFTKLFDERVYRTTLAGGARDTVFDFGVAGVARDPVWDGGRLFAIVGGEVRDTFLQNIGHLQIDGGGELWVAEGGGTQLVDAGHLWRHPARAPGGGALALEGRDLASGVTDIYVVRIP
ncbi:MAG TPA: hypothetical protein VFS07_00530 [Gemmatimonadales bacterium]|nr:hypothetical protein [Gemmatimonadales bacterium]